MNIELKIKSKHLSEEAKIIRYEERKLRGRARYLLSHQRAEDAANPLSQLNKLTNHRKHDVRIENRATFLARAFIDGRPYLTVENKRRDVNDGTFDCYVAPSLLKMIRKYHDCNITRGDLIHWVSTTA